MSGEILNKLDTAFKGITDVSEFGDSLLATQKFDRFVRAMQSRATVLQQARFIPMDSHVVEIDRVGFSGRILTTGATDDGTHRTLSEGEFVNPTTATNQLVAKELQAVTSLRDRALRRNIERGGFENTLIDLFGEASGRDLEEFAILADSDIAYADDAVLSMTDGWAKLAANKVYGQGTSKDFDETDSNFPENLFDALIDGLPKQYLTDRADWRIFVPFEVEDAYRNLLKARGTALGDTAQTTGAQLMYKGFKIEYAPMLERSKPLEADGNGRVAMLQHPDNMVWGVFHEVTIEREREAKARRTDFVLTVEADCHYEDENGAVVAFLDVDPEA